VLGALQLSEGLLLACVEAWKERLIAMGRLPDLLDTLAGWALSSPPGLMPSSPVRRAGGRMLQVLLLHLLHRCLEAA
jgi:hypothetical protein